MWLSFYHKKASKITIWKTIYLVKRKKWKIENLSVPTEKQIQRICKNVEEIAKIIH